MANLIEKNINIDGRSLHYWETGSQHQGRAVILLHDGMGDARLHWHLVMPHLADEFQVLAPDMPGFGKTSPLPQLTLKAWVEWLQKFIDELQLGQAVIIGNSFGALLTRLFAAAHPQYVPAAILVNGGSIYSPSPAARFLLQVPVLNAILTRSLASSYLSDKNLEQMIYVKETRTPEFAQKAREGIPGLAQLYQILASDLPKERQPIVPVLILWGAQDQSAPVEEANRIKASIPGAKVVPIAGCGHLPHLESSDVFVWQVQQFLNNLNRPTSNLPGVGILSDLP